MNQYLKTAYDHGVQKALDDAGITKTSTGIRDIEDHPLASAAGGGVGLLSSAALANLFARGKGRAGDLAALATILSGTGFGALEGARAANNSEGYVGKARRAFRDL